MLDSSAPHNWEQFVLPGTFINLSSVVFTALSALGGGTPEFLIDDIVVDSIPEPASLILLGTASWQQPRGDGSRLAPSRIPRGTVHDGGP